MSVFNFRGDAENDDAGAVEWPRFDHGEDLHILLKSDETVEFRNDAGAWIEAADAVAVEDVA